MKSNLTRLTIAMLAMLTVLASQAGTVAADQPTRLPLFPVPPFTLSGVCSFDVLINTLADKEYGTTFVDQAGNPRVTLITGTDKVSLTNLSNGKSIGLNISGPGRIMPDLVQPSTWITEGPWLWFITPGASPIYSPRMFFISGRMVVQFDSAGQITNLQIIGGMTQDMCAALADP